MTFIEIDPNTTSAYLTLVPGRQRTQLINSTTRFQNMALFSESEMNVTRVATGVYSKDLTPAQDDVLIAIFSLLLLFSLQGIITSFLLRVTPTKRISNRAFSLTHFLHLARDFRLRFLLTGRGEVARRMPINSRLAIVAVVLLVTTFATEFMILFFTSPGTVPVTNESASFSLLQPVSPDWPRLQVANRSVNVPCSVIFLSGVDQGSTQITTCLTSSIPQFEQSKFTRLYDSTKPPITLTISSDLYEFGMNHNLTLGDTTESYSSLAYYKLNDQKQRILPTRTMKGDNTVGMRHVHGMLLAFLFNAYRGDTGDTRVTPALLSALKTKTAYAPGPDINVIKRGKEERFHRVISERYVTTVSGVPPIDARPAQSFARLAFKSIAAVRVTGPDVQDVFLGSGTWTAATAVLWFEPARSLNWLGLLIALVLMFLLLVMVRFSLNSISPTDIAGLLVNKEISGGRSSSSGTEEGDVERRRAQEPRSFYFGLTSNGADFDFGLDRGDGMWDGRDGSVDNASSTAPGSDLVFRYTPRITESDYSRAAGSIGTGAAQPDGLGQY